MSETTQLQQQPVHSPSSSSSPGRWSASEVARWTSTLPLSQDYSASFKDRGIDGRSLQKMSRSTLEELGVKNPSDQLTILQSVVMMADGVLSPILSPTSSIPSDTASQRSRLSSCSVPSADLLASARHVDFDRHSSDGHNRRLFSRSVDGGLSESDRMESSNTPSPSRASSHLLDILREDNATLKKELETYYQHVRKVQKLELELERLREAHKLLEATTLRKGNLEEAMRHKLEEELRKLKEASCQHKAEMHTVKRAVSFKSSPPDETMKRELARRDSMISRLVKQNKDANSVREKLEKDLHSAQAALQEKQTRKKSKTTRLGSDDSGVDNNQMCPHSTGGSEDHMSAMYSASIDKLRLVLSAMQSSSAKRADLEQRLRGQLELRLQQLQQPKENLEVTGDERERVKLLEITVTALEADVVKWEQRCLELAAEKQMALDSAVIPRETKISHLERLLEESKETVKELREGKLHYMGLYRELESKTSRLESRISSLEASLREKETLIQTLQLLLDPEESEKSFSSSENNQYSDLPYDSYNMVSNHSPQSSSSTGMCLHNNKLNHFANGWNSEKAWLETQQVVTMGEGPQRLKQSNGEVVLMDHHKRTSSAKLAHEQPTVTYTQGHSPPASSSFPRSGIGFRKSHTMPQRPVSIMHTVSSAPSLTKPQTPPAKHFHPSSSSMSALKHQLTTNTMSFHSPHSSADSLDSLLTPTVLSPSSPTSSYPVRNSNYISVKSSKSMPPSQRKRLPCSGSFADDQSQDSGVLVEGGPYPTALNHSITCSQHIQL